MMQTIKPENHFYQYVMTVSNDGQLYHNYFLPAGFKNVPAARKLGKDGSHFEKQAEKIKKALNEKLWVPTKGVIAESVDTMDNCMMHTAVELPTVYHVIDSDMIDDLRAYRTLRYTEKYIKNIVTVGSDGRLCYSSAWLPKQYSTCGIFPAENAHLALVYFKIGLKEEGKKILDGIADCYFTGKNSGMAAGGETFHSCGHLRTLQLECGSDVHRKYQLHAVLCGKCPNHRDLRRRHYDRNQSGLPLQHRQLADLRPDD